MAEKSDGHGTSVAARTSSSPAEADPADIRAIFRQWDPTGRGMIRKDELLSTFSGLGLHMGKRETCLEMKAFITGSSSGGFLHRHRALRVVIKPMSHCKMFRRNSKPQCPASVEAEADETEIENCGDILQAAEEGNVGAVRRLLQVDPQSLEQVDKYGNEPLHFAAVHGHLEVFEALLAAGASVDAKSNDGWTPLHHAARWGHTAAVERLLAAGAAVDAVNNEGRTPLYWAAHFGHTAAVERLLAAGAAVDAADSYGDTPLHGAADRGHAAVVEQLLAAGAAVDAVSNEGQTPYDIAKERDHRKVMGVLDPVFVALLSGRSCRCNSTHETVQDLKEEAERKLGTTIEHLIGPDMQPLNGAMTLQEAWKYPDGRPRPCGAEGLWPWDFDEDGAIRFR